MSGHCFLLYKAEMRFGTTLSSEHRTFKSASAGRLICIDIAPCIARVEIRQTILLPYQEFFCPRKSLMRQFSIQVALKKR